jgi:hypothetical protein
MSPRGIAITPEPAATPPPAPGPDPGTPPPPAATSPTVATPSPVPSCTSRRRFSLHVEPRGVALRRVVVRVDGRRVMVRRRDGRLVAVIDLRGRPKGDTRVTIGALVAHTGRHYSDTRIYRTCAPPSAG